MKGKPRHRAGTLLQRTVEAIGRAIVNGIYGPGSILPVEDALATQFAVGRNVIREAIKILGEKHLLRTERRAGTAVLPGAEWNYLDQEVIAWTLENAHARDRIIDELSALRAIVEPEVAALAAQSASATQVLRLFEAVERMESASAEIATVEADIAFHERLFEATGNRLLFSLMRTVAAVLHANFELSIRVKQDIPQFLAEHRALAEAVRLGNAARARAIMRDLLVNNARHVAMMRSLDEHGIGQASGDREGDRPA